jgi:hypothetical protein
MNHVVGPKALDVMRDINGQGDLVGPVATAVATIERCLAGAHEDGDVGAVRRLHAALAVLTGGAPGALAGLSR